MQCLATRKWPMPRSMKTGIYLKKQVYCLSILMLLRRITLACIWPFTRALHGGGTSVLTTDTQVAWQGTRRCDVTDTCPTQRLHLPTKSAEHQFDNGQSRGSCERFHKSVGYSSVPATKKECLCRWRGQPVLSHIVCRPAAVSRLKSFLRSNGLAVAGSCVSGHWVGCVKADQHSKKV